jgi:hypothetical protein
VRQLNARVPEEKNLVLGFPIGWRLPFACGGGDSHM